jgi:hypothetical protein
MPRRSRGYAELDDLRAALVIAPFTVVTQPRRDPLAHAIAIDSPTAYSTGKIVTSMPSGS